MNFIKTIQQSDGDTVKPSSFC